MSQARVLPVPDAFAEGDAARRNGDVIRQRPTASEIHDQQVAGGGTEAWCFDWFSGAITEISDFIRFGNNHEGSIPFTRSIHSPALTTACSEGP